MLTSAAYNAQTGIKPDIRSLKANLCKRLSDYVARHRSGFEKIAQIKAASGAAEVCGLDTSRRVPSHHQHGKGKAEN